MFARSGRGGRAADDNKRLPVRTCAWNFLTSTAPYFFIRPMHVFVSITSASEEKKKQYLLIDFRYRSKIHRINVADVFTRYTNSCHRFWLAGVLARLAETEKYSSCYKACPKHIFFSFFLVKTFFVPFHARARNPVFVYFSDIVSFVH